MWLASTHPARELDVDKGLSGGSAEPEQDDRGQDDARAVVAGGLVVAADDAAPLLEPVEAAFDDVAVPADASIVASETRRMPSYNIASSASQGSSISSP